MVVLFGLLTLICASLYFGKKPFTSVVWLGGQKLLFFLLFVASFTRRNRNNDGPNPSNPNAIHQMSALSNYFVSSQSGHRIKLVL